MLSRTNRRHREKLLGKQALGQAVGCVAESLERRVLLSSSGQIFVANNAGNSIGEYNLDGTTVNASLVSGLNEPFGLALSGSDLFVSNNGSQTIGEYTTSGAVVNASLISGLDYPDGIAVSGSDLFVVNYGSGSIGEYTTSGAVVHASLVTGLIDPYSVAVSGTDLFVTTDNGVGEYTTSGGTVNANLINDSNGAWGITVSGSDLFVTNVYNPSIGEYTTSGGVVSAELVSGLNNPAGITVSGSDLFITNMDGNTIGEYTTSGGTVSSALVSGLNSPAGIAVNAAALTSPSVTTNPTSQSVSAGATATFTAAASGNPAPTVQWQISTNGGTSFTNILNATSTTYSFTTTAGETGNEYQAVFTNSQGTATTTAATLTVTPALASPSITTNPTSQSVSAGATATFTAAASGNPAPTVQWQISTNGGTSFTNISNATSTTYSFATTAGETSDEYQAAFTNSQGTATTTAASLTVTAAVAPNVSGIVYNDRNDGGVKTRKDPGMANITVSIQRVKHRKLSGRATAVDTSAQGIYSFTNLVAGYIYQISEVPPKGYTITQPSTGVYTIALSAGQTLTGENFGDYKGAKSARGAIAFVKRPSTPFATAGNPAMFVALQTDASALLFASQIQQGLFAV